MDSRSYQYLESTASRAEDTVNTQYVFNMSPLPLSSGV